MNAVGYRMWASFDRRAVSLFRTSETQRRRGGCNASAPAAVKCVMELSRRAIPYTPFDRDLSETTVALVSTAGVHLTSQEPFNTEGDGSYRVIPADTAAGDLTITHTHYDHEQADTDVNCVFPIERLRELAEQGTIKGVNAEFFGMMGYTLRMKQVIDETGPEIAKRIERSATDLVLLTGG